jgi:hypothetical protein
MTRGGLRFSGWCVLATLTACGGIELTTGDAGNSLGDAASAADGAASCSEPGAPTTATPPTLASATSDYNVTLLDCTRTATALACDVGTAHQYDETVVGSTRSIAANGIVDHDVGAFPNAGNPNTISAQRYAYTVPVAPSGAGRESTIFGIAFSGAVFDPGTAEVWNGDTTWRYEALRYETAPGYDASDSTMHPTALGLDCNFAHVQPSGSYHYHGIPTAMLASTPAMQQVGWAGDGAPIFARWGHADPADTTSTLVELRSSYRLRSGARPADGPPGDYDGTFGADWEYVAGLGDLDECNGRTGVATVDGAQVSTYYYVLTNTFPYIPRCWHSAPDASFDSGMAMGMGPPACTASMTTMCCGDGTCDGPETAANCAADC